MTDITERKRAEEALKESEQRFRTIFDNAGDGILLVERESRKFLIGNKMISQMLGYTQDEIKNLEVKDIIPEEDLLYNLDRARKQMGGEVSIVKDMPIKRKDGSVFYADGNFFEVTLAGKAQVGSILRDVTERKNVEKTPRDFIYKANNISLGECYLHGSHDSAYWVFSQLVLYGVPGLCISRDKPEKVLDYGISKDKIVIISSVPVKGFESIEKVQQISLKISDFLMNNKSSVVLLDGLEYLISRSSFETMYKFIQEKRFNFVEADANLLMPIDLAAFSEKERALLTSEIKILG